MKPVGIQGMGAVGGFGNHRDLLEKALLGALPVSETIGMDSPSGSFSLDVLRADVRSIDRIVGKTAMRRMDRYSRMALLAASQAMEDAGNPYKSSERMGIIVATGHGPAGSTCSLLDTIQDPAHPFPSPTHFSNSVHNAAAAHIAMHLGVTGPSLTVSQPEGAVMSALSTAGLWLAENRCDAVLFGAVDEFANILARLLWHLHQMGRKKDEDQDHPRLLIGEGSVFFLLTKEADSTARYGYVAAIHPHPRIHPPVFPNSIRFFSGIDYHIADGVRSTKTEETCSALSYQALYGFTPSAIIFDMAIALLSFKNGRIYIPWTGPSCANDWSPYHDVPVLNPENIDCLAWSGNTVVEHVHLRKNRFLRTDCFQNAHEA